MLFCTLSDLLTALAIWSPIADCADFGTEGKCSRPFIQIPLFKPGPALLLITSKGLNPTTSAEITSTVSVEKIGTTITSSTASSLASAVSETYPLCYVYGR